MRRLTSTRYISKSSYSLQINIGSEHPRPSTKLFVATTLTIYEIQDALVLVKIINFKSIILTCLVMKETGDLGVEQLTNNG